MRQFNMLWNSSLVGLLSRWLTSGPDLAVGVLECSSNVRREGCSPDEHYCQSEMPFELLTSSLLDPWLPTIASLDADTLQWKLNRASDIKKNTSHCHQAIYLVVVMHRWAIEAWKAVVNFSLNDINITIITAAFYSEKNTLFLYNYNHAKACFCHQSAVPLLINLSISMAIYTVHGFVEWYIMNGRTTEWVSSTMQRKMEMDWCSIRGRRSPSIYIPPWYLAI